jgi:hypothetical protein
MKAIQIPETQMMSNLACKVLRNPPTGVVEFQVPDSLDETIFNRYLAMARDKDEPVDQYDTGYLIKALTHAEKKGYDINSLLLIALLARKRQVIYEHHLEQHVS